MVRAGWFCGASAGRISVQEGVETVDFGIEAISFAAGGDELRFGRKHIDSRSSVRNPRLQAF